MKKITFLILTILPFLAFTQELAPNPTLNGTTDWSDNNPGTTQAYDGSFSRSSDGSGSWIINSDGTYNSGIKSANISGIVSGDYLFSYYVYGDAGDKIKPIIRDNGLGSNIQGTAYTIQTSNTWEHVEQTFTLSGTGTISLRALVNSIDTTMDFWVDDFSFTYIPPGGNSLSVNIIGSGTVAKNPDQISYQPTDVVTLTATPNTHWNFNSWTGDLTGSTNPQNITMDADKAVTANFNIDPTFNYAFTFDTDGDLEGWGTSDANVSLSGPASGLVTVGVTANQWARFDLYGFPIPSASYNKVTIILNNQTTNDKLGFNINGVVLNQPMTTGIQTYNFDLTQYATWTGNPDSIRIIIADSDNTTSKPLETGNIVIDNIVFSFDPALGSNNFKLSPFSIYPNPANKILNINSKKEVSKVQVYDITGKQVLETNRLNNNQLNVSSLKIGLYLLYIEDENKNNVIKKLVIE